VDLQVDANVPEEHTATLFKVEDKQYASLQRSATSNGVTA
jgi:hypothetical protein